MGPCADLVTVDDFCNQLLPSHFSRPFTTGIFVGNDLVLALSPANMDSAVVPAEKESTLTSCAFHFGKRAPCIAAFRRFPCVTGPRKKFSLFVKRFFGFFENLPEKLKVTLDRQEIRHPMSNQSLSLSPEQNQTAKVSIPAP